MKTIVSLGTNTSLYIFEDNEVVDMQADRTAVGDPLAFYIGDCKTSNAALIENVTPPEDWAVGKYTYTASGGWEVDPNWIDPTAS